MRVILKGIEWVLKVILGIIGAFLYLPVMAVVWLYELGETLWWNIEEQLGDWEHDYQLHKKEKAEKKAHAADAEYVVESGIPFPSAMDQMRSTSTAPRGNRPRNEYDEEICICGHARREHYGGPETEECAVCPCEGFILGHIGSPEETEDIPLSEQEKEPRCKCGHLETDHDGRHSGECDHEDCMCMGYDEKVER